MGGGLAEQGLIGAGAGEVQRYAHLASEFQQRAIEASNSYGTIRAQSSDAGQATFGLTP